MPVLTATAFYQTDWFKAIVYVVIAVVIARVVDFVLARRDKAMQLLGKSPDRAHRTRYVMIRRLVFAGKEYGTGSSRDWAAKGPMLLGVRAVITESFERIHRSNLIGMGVAPFCFEAGKSRKDYNLTGREIIDIPGLSGELKPRMRIDATIHYPDGKTAVLPLVLMIMTADEVSYYKNGGILPYVLRNLLAA